MKRNDNETGPRVRIQILVYPYVKELMEEIAAKMSRGSVSAVGEVAVTQYVGNYARKNGKKAK